MQQLSCSTHLKKRQDMRDQKTKAQIKTNTKNKIRDNTHPLSSHPNPDMKQQPPTYPIPPIIHNSNIMTQNSWCKSDNLIKCGSVKNDEIFNLHLRSGAGP